MDAERAIPYELAEFTKRRRPRFRCEDDDWRVEIRPPDKYEVMHMPPGSLVIAYNECGDSLFLAPSPTDGYGREVYAYWHDEDPNCRLYCPDISELTNPPPPGVSRVPQPTYFDGVTLVQIGDQVRCRSFFIWREGKVVYVPGVSIKNRNYEHGGITWVAIRTSNGTGIAYPVDLDTHALDNKVVFLARKAQDSRE